jgi:lysyl-tRNA synthetase class II
VPHVYIEDIHRHEGEEVTLRGWVYNKRSSGKLHFLQVRDGTGILRCVMFKVDVPPEEFAAPDHLPQESSSSSPQCAPMHAPLGFELSVKHLEVVSLAGEYPITPKDHGVAFLLDHRHLWLRSARQHAIMRVRAEIIRACREYFDSRGFTLIDAPIFTPNACEGTTTLFETDYFDTKAYLTQSGQLYVEATAMALGRVYCFGPTFRAEKSKTRRHLTEFWMVVVAFMDLDGDMDLARTSIEFRCACSLTGAPSWSRSNVPSNRSSARASRFSYQLQRCRRSAQAEGRRDALGRRLAPTRRQFSRTPSTGRCSCIATRRLQSVLHEGRSERAGCRPLRRHAGSRWLRRDHRRRAARRRPGGAGEQARRA